MSAWYCLTLMLAMSLLVRRCVAVDSCQWRTYEEPGDLHFGVILSMRSAEVNGTCGAVSYGALQLSMAVKYAIQKLNRPGENGQSFIPGVKIGFTVYDDCGNDKYATASANEIVNSRFPSEIVDCSRQNSSLFAGIIGPSRSQSAVAVSHVLSGTGIPLVGVATTRSVLSDKTLYPNLLRTAISDEEQAKAITALVKRLGWSVMAILHTTDKYGEDLAVSVNRLAAAKQTCVLRVERVTLGDLGSLHRAISALLEVQRTTASGSLGVVFLGQREAVTSLVGSLRADYLDKTVGVENLMWIFPDTIGQNSEPLVGALGKSNVDFLREVWSISPTSLPLHDLGQFLQSEINSTKNGSSNTNNHWLTTFVETTCHEHFEGPGCETFEQSDYANGALHAVYALSMAAREYHQQACNGTSGICPALRGKHTIELLSSARGVSFKYSDFDSQHTVPEFVARDTFISFDENGDVRQQSGQEIYSIYRFAQRQFTKVGSFYENGSLELGATSLQPSLCGGSCSECINNPPFVYLPGKILLAGFFSLHWYPRENTDPFGCGTFRNEVHTIISVESLFYTVKKMRQETGKDFGAIVFDDCYNSLKADSIVSKFFSGDIPLVDPVTQDVIDFSRVVGVIGSESSSVSLPLAESFTKLRLPIISPMSTTPDYDDKGLYPYSLRTVNSDSGTMDVIVAILKHFRWNYVNIMYTNNNYGYKAMRLIQEKAREENICVAEPISIDITPGEKHLIGILKTLSTNKAKVVVYVGLEEDSKAFQDLLKTHEIELVFISLEDWAVGGQPYPGTEQATVGSLLVLPIASQLPWDDFADYLVSRKPERTKTSLWFDRFWQSKFQCDLPGRFEKQFQKECNSSLDFTLTEAQSWLKQFRVVNTINAVAALIKGVTKASQSFCNTETDFACKTYRENPANVTTFIREINLGSGSASYRPFRDDGNGNLDFSIHNLQRSSSGKYQYVTVGQYFPVKRRLSWSPDEIVHFYVNNGREIVSEVDGSCTQPEICKACTTQKDSSAAMTSSGPCEKDAIQLVILIILCIASALVVVILVFLIVTKCERTTRKDRPSSEKNDDVRAIPLTAVQNGGVALYPRFENGTSNYNYSTYTSDVISSTLAADNFVLDGSRQILIENRQSQTVVQEEEDPYLHATTVAGSSVNRPENPNSGIRASQQITPTVVDSLQGMQSDEKDSIQPLDEEQTTLKLTGNDAQTRSDRYSILPNAVKHPSRQKRLQQEPVNLQDDRREETAVNETPSLPVAAIGPLPLLIAANEPQPPSIPANKPPPLPRRRQREDVESSM